MSVGLARSVVKQLRAEDSVTVAVKPWLNNLLGCLLRGSWHPPVITINGRRFSQGVVPDRQQLADAVTKQLKVSQP